MRVLVVEDEKKLADLIGEGLAEENYAVDVAYDGEEGLFMAENETSDLIILDIMLPYIDGLEILHKLRKKGIQTPVLLLTARDSLQDKVTGLDQGADDYLTKPFVFDELMARVRALLRRTYDVKSTVVNIRDLIVDTAAHEVSRKNKKIVLSAKEYALFEYFILNRNRVLSRTELYEHCYSYLTENDSNVLDVLIFRIRNKIRGRSGQSFIQTVRGSGYILRD